MKSLAHYTAIMSLMALSFVVSPAPAAAVGLSADAWFGATMAAGDFNGDGRPDLAVGAMYETVNGATRAGRVYVFMNQGGSLAVQPESFARTGIADFRTSIPSDAASDDMLAYSLAAGDFNGDGFDDLAIGAPGADPKDRTEAGTVFIIYGSSAGLDCRIQPQAYFHQDHLTLDSQFKLIHQYDLPGDIESYSQVGWALASGDFDNNGYDDLAVGAPSHDVGGVGNAGAVLLVYGSSGGLDGRIQESAAFMQSSASSDKFNLVGSAETDDSLGLALSAGDFNGDGWDDLAIGAPGEDIGSVKDAGLVTVVYGMFGAGLHAQVNPQGFDQNGSTSGDKTNLAGTCEEGDWIGSSLASGDFNGDGYDDLAIGAPFEDVDGVIDAGMVMSVLGSPSGLDTSLNSRAGFDQGGITSGGDKYDIGGVLEYMDYVGGSLASGDFNGDGFDDLAVGVPWEDIDNIENAGFVALLYGSGPGLNAQIYNHSGFDQSGWYGGSDYDLPGAAEANDQVGFALCAADFNGDYESDLAIGAPREDIGSTQDAGFVMVVFGNSSGMDAVSITPESLTADGPY